MLPSEVRQPETKATGGTTIGDAASEAGLSQRRVAEMGRRQGSEGGGPA